MVSAGLAEHLVEMRSGLVDFHMASIGLFAWFYSVESPGASRFFKTCEGA